MSLPGRFSRAELSQAMAAPRPSGPMASRFVSVSGLRTHYRAEREPTVDAVPVVLVHGLAVSHRYLMPLASALAGWHPVLVPDLPGFGLSAKPARAYTVEEHARHLADWLTALALGPVCVLGHSFGASVVTALASRYPERVSALVLAGPTTDPAARTKSRQIARFVVDAPREALAQAVILMRDVWDAGPTRVWRTLELSNHYHLEKALPAVSAPTLVIGGERDPLAPAGWRHRMLGLLPDGRALTIAGAAHNVATTAAPQVARAVVRFLQDGGSDLPAAAQRPD